MSNVNAETGIRYGVIDARYCMEFYNDICTNGDSITYRNWKEEMISAILSGICGALDMSPTREERLSGNLRDIAENTFDALADDGVFDDTSFEEEEYEYEENGNQYLLSYLGGAPLIWAIKTSNIVNVQSLCSPCVPNAGDLNSGLVSSGEGYECYGLPEDCFTDEELKEYKSIGDDGKLYIS